MDDRLLDEIRPMIWSVQVIAPSASADVTVLMRVSYRSIEEICSALLESRQQALAGARLS